MATSTLRGTPLLDSISSLKLIDYIGIRTCTSTAAELGIPGYPRVGCFLTKGLHLYYCEFLKSPDRTFELAFLEVFCTKFRPGDVIYAISCYPSGFRVKHRVSA